MRIFYFLMIMQKQRKKNLLTGLVFDFFWNREILWKEGKRLPKICHGLFADIKSSQYVLIYK